MVIPYSCPPTSHCDLARRASRSRLARKGRRDGRACDDLRPMAEPPAKRPTLGLDVVVVDDDPRWREAAAEPFRMRGDRVRAFSDGLEALAECIAQPPDVILTDVQMPRMDGWQLLRMLRARPGLASTPVVFLTSLDGDAERLRGFQLGVDAYLPKPFRSEELLLRVHRLVRQALDHAPEREGIALRGDLEHVTVASLLSFLAMEKKTGILLLVGPQVVRVFINDGRPLRAEVEGVRIRPSSREVLHEVLDWNAGQFEVLEQTVSGLDELRGDANSLVLEHARLKDEGARRGR